MTDDSLSRFLADYGADTLKGENWTLELPDGEAKVRSLMAKHMKGMTPEDFAQRLAARLPGEMKMTFYIRPDGTGAFSFGVYGAGGTLYARASRKFDAANGLVDHEDLRVNERFRGRGLGGRLLVNAVSAYRAAGFSTIECGAGNENGAYTWARLGFLPSRAGWEGLRDDLRHKVSALQDRLNGPTRAALSRVMGNDDPRALWLLSDLDQPVDGVPLGRRLLTGAAWPARFGLSDTAQVNRLVESVKARAPGASRPAQAPDRQP